jgi:hypothetical protein
MVSGFESITIVVFVCLAQVAPTSSTFTASEAASVLDWTSGMETIMLKGGITADCNSEVGESIEVRGSFCGIGQVSVE